MTVGVTGGGTIIAVISVGVDIIAVATAAVVTGGSGGMTSSTVKGSEVVIIAPYVPVRCEIPEFSNAATIAMQTIIRKKVKNGLFFIYFTLIYLN